MEPSAPGTVIFNGAYRFTMDDVYRHGIEQTVLDLLGQVEQGARRAIASHEFDLSIESGHAVEKDRIGYCSRASNTRLTSRIKTNG